MKRRSPKPDGERALPAGHQCVYFLAHGWLMGLLVPAAVGVWRGELLWGIAAALALNSLACILFYAEDKVLAERGLWRIPERCLHMWALLGGWPGALFARRKFRHKSRKTSFRIVFWLCVLLDLAILAGIAYFRFSARS